MISRRRFSQATAAGLLLPAGGTLLAQTGDIKVALIVAKTGPFEAYAKQDELGFRIGLEYLTGGSMAIDGRKVQIIVKDDQLRPDLSKALLAEAYADDKVDIAVGAGGSSGTVAALPIAEEYKKILIVEPSAADSITGDKWNRYVFRVARTTSLDATASVSAFGGPVTVAFLAQDNVFGRDNVTAYKEAFARLNPQAKMGHEEFVPQGTTDFTAPFQRIADSLKGASGRKVLVIPWGGEHPIRKLAGMNPERFGIELSPGGSLLSVMQTWREFEGLEGGTYYHYKFPRNKANDWLVTEHMKRYKMPPDFFVCGGFSAASAVVTAIRKARSTDTEKLIAAMEGMDFETPKGTMTFRPEDHQAMMPMYHFKMKKRAQQGDEWDILELVREIPASEIKLPIRNKRG
ncbi:substrate-binding domain-containing protein [Variovorax sp. J22P271]|uniref:substrate-binding domain-containing protein n=1 Tax=Variovorax davisae TaxID=3053515 RepID=UPI002577F379|nr:substrate-binding domain-containing protein [Variovorax sp. J22P271]MDM0030597.1 substrate-binding domain-containing protein [Variovorax sp. J22P271]